MAPWPHDFHYFDHVQFIGRHADELRNQGECTTGVVQISTYGESDPNVWVELDTMENSGQGGGSTHILYAPYWQFFGTPIELSPLGHRLRRIKRYRRHLVEQHSRPVELRNARIIARLEAFLAAHDRGQQLPLFV